MPSSPEKLDVIFAALSHSKRRSMLLSLSFRPETVGSLAREHSISLPAMHKHVRILEEAGLIQRKKVGRTNFVAIGRTSLQGAKDWISLFNAHWGSDQETLENHINRLTNQHPQG